MYRRTWLGNILLALVGWWTGLTIRPPSAPVVKKQTVHVTIQALGAEKLQATLEAAASTSIRVAIGRYPTAAEMTMEEVDLSGKSIYWGSKLPLPIGPGETVYARAQAYK